MSFHFRGGKVYFLDANMKEWGVRVTDELISKPNEQGLCWHVKLQNHVLELLDPDEDIVRLKNQGGS